MRANKHDHLFTDRSNSAAGTNTLDLASAYLMSFALIPRILAFFFMLHRIAKAQYSLVQITACHNIPDCLYPFENKHTKLTMNNEQKKKKKRKKKRGRERSGVDSLLLTCVKRLWRSGTRDPCRMQLEWNQIRIESKGAKG
jgi:hypothetical protein